MKSFILSAVLILTGLTAFADDFSEVYCMTTNFHYCLECSVDTACRSTMDVEQIYRSDDGQLRHNTIAVGICEEDLSSLLQSPACKPE